MFQYMYAYVSLNQMKPSSALNIYYSFKNEMLGQL